VIMSGVCEGCLRIGRERDRKELRNQELETRITNLKAEKEAFWIQLIEAKEELVKEKACLDWVLDECSVEYDPEPTTLDVRNRDAIKRYMEPS